MPDDGIFAPVRLSMVPNGKIRYHWRTRVGTIYDSPCSTSGRSGMRPSDADDRIRYRRIPRRSIALSFHPWWDTRTHNPVSFRHRLTCHFEYFFRPLDVVFLIAADLPRVIPCVVLVFRRTVAFDAIPFLQLRHSSRLATASISAAAGGAVRPST